MKNIWHSYSLICTVFLLFNTSPMVVVYNYRFIRTNNSKAHYARQWHKEFSYPLWHLEEAFGQWVPPDHLQTLLRRFTMGSTCKGGGTLSYRERRM